MFIKLLKLLGNFPNNFCKLPISYLHEKYNNNKKIYVLKMDVADAGTLHKVLRFFMYNKCSAYDVISQ